MRKIPIHKSYFGRMILMIAIVFLMVVSVSFGYLYAGVRKALRNRTDAERIRTYRQLEQNLEVFQNEMELLSMRTANNAALFNMIVNTGGDISWDVERKMDFFSVTDDILGEYSYIRSVCLFTAEGEILFADGKYNVIEQSKEEKGRFFEENLRNAPEAVSMQSKWYGRYNSEDFGVKSGNWENPKRYITVCRPVFRGIYRGWLVLNIDLNYFTGLYNSRDAMTGGQEKLYLLDRGGTIISCLNQNMLGEQRKDYRRTPGQGYETLEEGKKQILCYPISMGNWTMVNEIPLAQIIGDVKDIRQIFAIAVVCVAILSALFIVLWMKWMSRPLLEVVDGLQKVEQGQFGVTLRCEKEREDEIGLLIRYFNQMSMKIRHLIEENVQIEQKKRDAQMQVLKAQINPHFLYNTLNTIKWMALMKGEADMADCMGALGDLLSPIFKDSREYWMLEEEREYIENYAKIMNYRYGNQAKIEYQIPTGLQDALVPKFVLQPLVENAFLYGRTERSRKLRIVLSAKTDDRTEQEMLLTVEDDGRGLAPEELQTLRDNLEKEEKKGHIGLRNIYQRLRLLYGENFSMEISDKKEDAGFYVRLRFPVKYGEL